MGADDSRSSRRSLALFVLLQVNPYISLRGPQSGYNICNSTTLGADSECQTLIVNSVRATVAEP